MEWDGGFGGGSHEEEEKRDPAQDYLDAWRRRQEEIDRKSPGTGWGGSNPVPRTPQPEYGGDDGGGDDHHHDDYHKPEVPVYGEEAGGENEEDHGEHRKPEVPVYTAPETTADATEETAGAAEIKPANAAQATETIVYEGVGTGGQKAGPDASGTKDALTEEEEKQPDWMTYGAGTGRRSGEERANRAMAEYKPKPTPQPTAGNMTGPQQTGGVTAGQLESQWFNADGTPKQSQPTPAGTAAGSKQMSVADAMAITGRKGGMPKLTPQTPATPTPAVGSPSGQMTVEDAKAIQEKKGGGIPGYVPPAKNGYVPASGLRDNPPAQSTVNNNVPSSGYVPTNYLRENPGTAYKPSTVPGYRANQPESGFVYNPTTGNMEVDTGQTYRDPNKKTDTESMRHQPGYTNVPYVKPGNGYVPTNILRSEDYKVIGDYSPEDTVYGANGEAREVGIDTNGIFDRPISFEDVLKKNPDYKEVFDDIVMRVKENGTAQTDEEANAYAINALAPELGLDPKKIIEKVPESYYQPTPQKSAQEKYEERAEIYQDAYDQAIDGGKSIKEAEEAAVAAVQKAMEKPSAETPSQPKKSAYDLDAVMGSGEMVYDPDRGEFVYQPKTVPTTGGTAGNGSGTGTGGTGTGSGAGTSTAGTGDKTVPPGSQYFRPSYGQDMEKGVKAPYRKGGYTEEEIRAMGNVEAGKDRYSGKNFYEGYYFAPDQHYYPVDQIKANYYMRNGSYKGWEEGMRDYWNTFGTFYGYRPNWKVTGRGGGGRRYYGGGGGGSSYGRGGSSSGNNGSTNGGMYWNGNTSWSI